MMACLDPGSSNSWRAVLEGGEKVFLLYGNSFI